LVWVNRYTRTEMIKRLLNATRQHFFICDFNFLYSLFSKSSPQCNIPKGNRDESWASVCFLYRSLLEESYLGKMNDIHVFRGQSTHGIQIFRFPERSRKSRPTSFCCCDLWCSGMVCLIVYWTRFPILVFEI